MKIQLVLFWLSALLWLASPSLAQTTAAGGQSWEERKKQAIGLHGQGEYDEAARLLEKFPPEDTAFATANFYLASASLVGQRYQQGIEVAQKGLALKNNPHRKFLYDFMGAAYYELDQYDSSKAVYETAIKEFPDYYRYHLGIALSCYQLKQYNEAVARFQYTVKLNPFNSLSHFYLGMICMQNNYCVPALLSFQMYLLLETDGDRSVAVLTSYEKLVKGGWSVDKDSLYWRMPNGTNDFADLEKLINSRIALSDKYKARVDISYASIVKQMQLLYEQIRYSKSDTGFWMQYYVPFVKEVWDNGLYEGVGYHAFSALKTDADVVKMIKKKNAEVTKMIDFSGEYWLKQRREYWKALGLSRFDTWFTDQGALRSEGMYDETIRKPVGYWKYYRNSGYPDHEGSFDQQGREQGKWKYYDETGRLILIRSTRDGMLHDTSWTYHENGALEEINVYRENQLNGVTVAYFSTGAMLGRVTFAMDKKEGPFEYGHETGGTQMKGAFKNGVMIGPTEEFYPNGMKKERYTMIDGRVQGLRTGWYDDGTIQFEGTAINGKSTGKWKYYHPNGALEREGEMSNGDFVGPWKYYNPEGQLIRTFTAVNGFIEGEDVYYDDDGKLWSKFFNSKGKVMSYQYFDKSGKEISAGKRDGKKLAMKSFHANGVLLREGTYMDGLQEGNWKEYNNMGVLVRDEQFRGGRLEGEQRYYYNTGPLKSVFTYVEGRREGEAREYHYNGKLAKLVIFHDDELEGYYYEYANDGTLTEQAYYMGGKPNGTMKQYDVLGKLRIAYEYSMDDILSVTAYDSLGNVLSFSEVKAGSGQVNMIGMGSNKPVVNTFTYKYGHLDGAYADYHSDGQRYRTVIYKYGQRNGWRETYDIEGKLKETAYFVNGTKDSVQTTYQFGEKQSEQTFRRGMLHGRSTWFYPNGKVETQGTYAYDLREGYFQYYAPGGQVRFRLHYREGIIQSYSYLGPDSNYVPEVLLSKGTGSVKAFFSNGRVSADFAFKNGSYDGPYTLYFPDGTTAFKTSYANTMNQGKTVEYFPDGKLMSEEMYVDDELNGTVVYYYPGGRQRMNAQVRMGKFHGWLTLYDSAGNVKKKKYYYNDDAIE